MSARDERDLTAVDVKAVNGDVICAMWSSPNGGYTGTNGDAALVMIWDADDWEVMGDHVGSDPTPAPMPLAEVELSASAARKLAATLLAVADALDDAR